MYFIKKNFYWPVTRGYGVGTCAKLLEQLILYFLQMQEMYVLLQDLSLVIWNKQLIMLQLLYENWF